MDRTLGFFRSSVSYLFLFISLLSLCSCAFLPGDSNYSGPEARPALLDTYYDRGSSYSSFTVEPLPGAEQYNGRRFIIQTQYGETKVDLFQAEEKSDDLVFVFPVLGGKNDIVDHFAKYFARRGFDAAVIHRDSSFKDPKNFDRLEDIMRNGLIRDRIVMDFFEKEFGKKDFGSFGLSRGAINAAILAGVDPRLKHNVFALGGSDLVAIYNHSSAGRLRKYKDAVMSDKGITEVSFTQQLRDQIKSDPKYLSKYIDARQTLLVLALFDQTVPIKYGLKLRSEIGNPDTVFLMANHYTSLLFSSFVPILLPSEDLSLFPMGYVELEATNFYQKRMRNQSTRLGVVPLRILQIPFSIIGKIVDSIFGRSSNEPKVRKETEL